MKNILMLLFGLMLGGPIVGAQQQPHVTGIKSTGGLEAAIGREVPGRFRYLYASYLKQYYDDPEAAGAKLEAQVAGPVEEMSKNDMLMYANAIHAVGKIRPTKPEDIMSTIYFWNRTEEIHEQEGYLPGQVLAKYNLGKAWGIAERKFKEVPKRSIEYLEDAMELEEHYTDKKWVTLTEHFYQNGHTTSTKHRQDPDTPEAFPFSRERLFGALRTEAGQILTAKSYSPAHFQQGIDYFIEGAIDYNCKPSGQILAGYTGVPGVMDDVEAAMAAPGNKDKPGYQWLLKVKEVGDKKRLQQKR